MIHTAHNHLRNAGLNDGSCAHLAGFQGNVNGAFLQAPVSNVLAGLFDGGDLRMGQGVLVSVAPIITPADDLSLMDNANLTRFADSHCARPNFITAPDFEMHGYFSVAVFRGFVKMFMARRLFFWYTVLGEPYSGPGKIVFLSGQKMAVFLPRPGGGNKSCQGRAAFLGRTLYLPQGRIRGCLFLRLHRSTGGMGVYWFMILI